MRTQTFISSMVGVAAAVAVAGSANAAIVTGSPADGRSNCATFDNASSTTITYSPGGSFWNGAFDNSGDTGFAINTQYKNGSNVVQAITVGLIEYSYNAGTSWNVYSSGSTSTLQSSVYNGDGALVNPIGTTVGTDNFRVRIVIGASAGSLASTLTSGTFTMGLSYRTDAGGQDRSAVSTVVPVPAPGALALLGVAGIVGARRRRA